MTTRRRGNGPFDLPLALDRVRAALACVGGERMRSVRVDEGCLLVDYKGNRNRYGYCRFRPERAGWLLEKVVGGDLEWRARARGKTLDELLARWANRRLLEADIACQMPADGAASLRALLASPPRRMRRPTTTTPRAPKIDRRAIRAELEAALARHDAWLHAELAKLSYRPPRRLRRIQLEWDPMGLHDGLSWGARAVDAEGDEANEAAPNIRGRNLWPAVVRRRIGGSEPGWHEEAASCIEQWVLDGYKRVHPTPPCPVYLSLHEGLDRGLNLATGRRATFRDG